MQKTKTNTNSPKNVTPVKSNKGSTHPGNAGSANNKKTLNQGPNRNRPRPAPSSPKMKTTNANGSSSKSKSQNSTASVPKGPPLVAPVKRMGRRSEEIEDYNKSAKPYLTGSKASVAFMGANIKRKSKNRSSAPKAEDRKKNKITFSSQDMIKIYIPHEASYRISSENIFNVMSGLSIFDYADALWVEAAPSAEAGLPFSLFEYDVYDDSEQRIIICVPEFKNVEDMNDEHNPVLDGSSENVSKKDGPYFEEIPFEFNCQTVVGKAVCKISYHSQANPIKTKCYQTAVRLMTLDIFMRDRKMGTVAQLDNLILVKDSTNRIIMEVADVPITQGGFCVPRDKAFQCEVHIYKNKNRKLFGVMGRNGKRQKRATTGPALGFYFTVSDRPLPIATLSLYKIYGDGMTPGQSDFLIK